MLELEWLGRVNYPTALDYQQNLVAARTNDPTLPDQLLLLEHPPTYTIGRRGDMANLLVDEARLSAEDIHVHRINRGGDITYHGPGQLVGYPIMNLKRVYADTGRKYPDLHDYVRRIEEVIIRTLAAFDLRGWRYEGYTGVWVDGPSGPEKMAAIGIGVNPKGISSHGFALNVATDLTYFDNIVPCGISEHAVTSLQAMVNQPVTIQDVIPLVTDAFEQVFATRVTPLSNPTAD